MALLHKVGDIGLHLHDSDDHDDGYDDNNRTRYGNFLTPEPRTVTCDLLQLLLEENSLLQYLLMPDFLNIC